MRILLITDWMPGSGGVEWYVTAVRDELRARGHEARLLTSDVSSRAREVADHLARGFRRTAAQAVLQIANPWAVRAVRRVLEAYRPDVVHVGMVEHHLSPAIFGALDGVPTVLSVMDYKPVCPTSWKLLPDGTICTHAPGLVCWRSGCTSLPHWLRDRPRYRLLRGGIARVDRVLAPSRRVRDELARVGIRSEVGVLPVGDVGGEFRRRPAAEPRFVFLGRLSREKGVALLLRAFAALEPTIPGARLRIVGRGPERSSLERRARELGIDECVDFVGWVSPTEVERELVEPWALVAPSLHPEPLGLVAPEAIVRGVPVVASADGGFAETVVEGESGILFPNGSVSELRAALDAVARGRVFPDHVLETDVVRAAAETHDLERHVGSLLEVYDEVSGAGARTG